ncbi:hypothetical protein E3N88_41020 [Mikania micrantha]|uniref:Small nuclear ribonucleoprotein E n=1 Tax=Mikania micrantha TaxID=192012 RepID=A0A5N6LP87_9ASTR|nr:hypothetical protein E3N88_41020 [Mikania micrantha]
MISISENPIIGNNQTGDAYWSKIETYYNDAPPMVSRDAHNLRSHWHMFKSKMNRFNDLYLQVKSRYKSGWSDDQYLVEARLLYINDPSNKTSAPFTYEHVWNVVKDHGAPAEFANYLQRFKSLRSKDTHIALRNDLMEHLWDLRQANQEVLPATALSINQRRSPITLTAAAMATKVQRIMTQPINLIFRFLQSKARIQIWLFEQKDLRIEGRIIGFDEYMNLVLDEAEEISVKKKTRKALGESKKKQKH